MSVAIVLVAETDVRGAVSQARARGYVPCAVDVDDRTGRGHRLGTNLLPAALRPRQSAFRRLGGSALGLMLVLGVGAVIAADQAETSQALGTAAASLAIARNQSGPALEARQVATALRQQVAALKANVERAGRASTLIEQLTRAVPDSAYLTSIDISEGTVRVGGEAESAAAVLAALDRDATLGTVRFAAPVIRASNRNRDRFEIEITRQANDANGASP